MATNQTGNGPSVYGSEVEPTGQQPMHQIDKLNGDAHDRTDSPASFTGGRGPDGGLLGGVAEGGDAGVMGGQS